MQPEGGGVADGGGFVVAGGLLGSAESGERGRLAEPVAEIAVEPQRLALQLDRRLMQAGGLVDDAKAVPGSGLADPVAELAVQVQRFFMQRGRLGVIAG